MLLKPAASQLEFTLTQARSQLSPTTALFQEKTPVSKQETADDGPEYFPVGQSGQSIDPEFGWYVLAGHSVHHEPSGSDLFEPAGHGAQVLLAPVN